MAPIALSISLLVLVVGIFLLHTYWNRLQVFRRRRFRLKVEADSKPILDSVRMGILIIDVETSKIVQANPAAVGMIGAPKEKIIGSVCHDFICPAERGQCPITTLHQTIDNSERVLLKPNGDKAAILKTVVPVTIADRQCLIESFVDISSRKQTEEALKEANARLEQELAERQRAEAALMKSDERYALAVRGANDGIWDWDLTSQQIYFSPRWKEMLGDDEGRIGARPDDWFSRVHPDDLPRLQADLDSHLRGQTSHFETEYRMSTFGGEEVWMLCRGLAQRDAAGRPTRLAGSQSDITRRKIAEERLAHDALHDPLTGLPNRTLFMDRLEHASRRGQRVLSHQSAVLFLDLDRFKWINDSLGHQLGDQLLTAIGHRLETCIRPGDTVARFGGDEFAILLDGVQDEPTSAQIASRVQEELQKPFELAGHTIAVSASIGIATCASDPESSQALKPDDVLREADMAMYQAKSMGRARHEVFDQSMYAHAITRLRLEEDLRRALERGEFRVHFQPIVSLAKHAVTGVEALLRWEHPERGLVLPGDFIPVAEETGLIVPIGQWVLRTACAQLKAWHAAGHPELEVAVNCSARQFQDPHLSEVVALVLSETGIPASKLQIEITESTAMNDRVSRRTLDELDAMGVQISLDDFGDGFSALGNLKQLPLNILKIDQSLLRGIVLESENAAIATAIIAMARSLNLRPIAEGVETEAERDFLAARQCDEVQGYLFSRPAPAEQITALLAGASALDPLSLAV